MSDTVTVDPLEDKIVTLNFSVKDLNLILNILGQLPFVQSVGVINAIQAQCAPQIEAFNNELKTTS
jgi:hypothetical protein